MLEQGKRVWGKEQHRCGVICNPHSPSTCTIRGREEVEESGMKE